MNTTILALTTLSVAVIALIAMAVKQRRDIARQAALAESRRAEVLALRERDAGMRNQLAAMRLELDARAATKEALAVARQKLSNELDQTFSISGRNVVRKDGFAETDYMFAPTQPMSRL